MDKQLQQLQAEVRELAYQNFQLTNQVSQSSQIVSALVEAVGVKQQDGQSLTLDAVFKRIEQLKALESEPK